MLKSTKRTKKSKNRFNYTIDVGEKELEINKIVITMKRIRYS